MNDVVTHKSGYEMQMNGQNRNAYMNSSIEIRSCSEAA